METPKTEDALTTADTVTLKRPTHLAAAPQAKVRDDDPTVIIPELVLPSTDDTL